jgi:hypothetical protein
MLKSLKSFEAHPLQSAERGARVAQAAEPPQSASVLLANAVQLCAVMAESERTAAAATTGTSPRLPVLANASASLRDDPSHRCLVEGYDGVE